MSSSSDSSALPTVFATRLVAYVVGFGVAVGVGMAPFLGARPIQGFEPLLSLFPEDSKILLKSVSAFLMGVVAVVAQFHSGETISRRSLRRRFTVLSSALVLGLIALVLFHILYVVPIEGTKESVIVGWSRLPGCECEPTVTNSECVLGLALDLGACWSEGSIQGVKIGFYLTYLLATGGFGALIGLLALQEIARYQATRRKAEQEAKEKAEQEAQEKKKQEAREKREAAKRAQKPESAISRAAEPRPQRTAPAKPTPSVGGAAPKPKPPTVPPDDEDAFSE